MPTLKSLQPTITHTTVESPLGDLTVVAHRSEVVGLYFPHHWHRPEPSTFGRENDMYAEDVRHQLGEYFAGRRRTFDLPLAAEGDGLQRRVWALIDQVPYGGTATYGQLARDLADGTTPQEVGPCDSRPTRQPRRQTDAAGST
jgi:methylated-DNA-[protein]-cysteine S-methyltransferase